jgi:hypothetical protein
MSSADTRHLIESAVARIQEEVPALRQLKLVVRLELRAHGGDTPIWRVELPGPKVSKEPTGDERIDVSVGRPEFNELAAEADLRGWAEAYEHGQVRVTGDQAVLSLLGSVFERHLTRARGG